MGVSPMVLQENPGETPVLEGLPSHEMVKQMHFSACRHLYRGVS